MIYIKYYLKYNNIYYLTCIFAGVNPLKDDADAQEYAPILLIVIVSFILYSSPNIFIAIKLLLKLK